ncbi:hypothetical protein [Mycolicibacterium lutetiense]
MRKRRPIRPTGCSMLHGWSIRNVHERWLDLPSATVWELLAELGSEGDIVWPSRNWPSMKLDAPLRVGASGGHGAVRYQCTALVPRRLIEFTFDSIGGRPLDGHHAFEILERSGGVLLRHTIDAQVPDLIARWRFCSLIQPTHDVVIEELFDVIELLTGKSSESSTPRWSLWVRLLRHRRGLSIRPVSNTPTDHPLGRDKN